MVEQGEFCRVVEIEKSPTNHHQDDAVDMEEDGRDVVDYLQQRVFFQGDNHPKVHTPENKIPACTMPHTGEKPHDKNVHHLMPAVAAQRDVDVVAEKAAQRYVPAAPEVGNGIAAVGMVEVFIEMEAHAAPHAYRHIAVAGEVEVDLKRERNDAEPRAGGGKMVDIACEQLVADFRELVGNNHLFAQANEKAVDALGEIGSSDLPVVNFLSHRAISHNRARNKLWKHTDIEQQIAEMTLHRRLLAINVDEIRNGLESVETNADGQRNLRVGDLEAKVCIVDDLGEKTQVFKHTQDAQIAEQTNNECRFPMPLGAVDNEPGYEVDHHASQHQKHIDGFAPRVEDEREDDQHHVFGNVASAIFGFDMSVDE